MAGKPYLSDDRKLLLARLVDDGVTLEDMQKVHGFNYKTIRRLYPDYRTKVSSERIDHYDDLLKVSDSVYAMLDDGCSLAEIRETLGVKSWQVRWLQMNSGWTKSEAGSFGGMVARNPTLR